MGNIILEHYNTPCIHICYSYTEILEINTFKAAAHYHIYEIKNNTTVHWVTISSSITRATSDAAYMYISNHNHTHVRPKKERFATYIWQNEL